MEQIEKKELKVDASASKSIKSWKNVSIVFAVLAVIIGIISVIGGIVDYDTEATTVGIILICCSIPLFITNAILKGIHCMTEASEYYKAIVWKDYNVRDL